MYPVEIKTTSDPAKSMVSAFRCLAKIPGKISGSGVLICMAREMLPLTNTVWTLPVHLL